MLATLDRTSYTGTSSKGIGIRELRQNASRYLEQVEAGESLDVTRNGKVIARLVPVERTDDDPLAELLATGALRLPDEAGDLLEVVPAVGDTPTAVSDALAAQRGEERW
jgi:prevent-host-death family protein